jgi:hypothetical protein
VIRRLWKMVKDRVGAPEEINGAHRCATYLYRWHLAGADLLGWEVKLYLHKFVGDDWSLDLHDHPKRFVSIGLLGRYTEHTTDGAREYRAPWVRTFPAEHTHRLTGPTAERPCYTLVIVGTPSREWGFHRGDTGEWVAWRPYVSERGGRADAARSCQ